MLIAGNWKLNCNIAEANRLTNNLLSNFDGRNLNCDVAIFPPYTALSEVSKLVKSSAINIGAQDCSIELKGAYTGEVSVEMLSDLGCKYVILGHSERRMLRLETNENVLQKVKNAQNVGLIPIVCVGESEKDRDEGRAIDVIIKQLDNSLPLENNNLNCIIAYEPVWAIGTGKIPTIDTIKEMFSVIKDWLLNKYNVNNINILYGGSVDKSNVTEIFSCKDVGGLLIGGVSLKAEEFSEICLNI